MRLNTNLPTIIISVLCLVWLMLGNIQNIVVWDDNVMIRAAHMMFILIIFIPAFSCMLNRFVLKTNTQEALINVLTPLSFYYMLKMLEYNKMIVVIAVIVFLALGIFVFEVRRRYVKRRIISIVYFFRYIWCGVFIIILLPAHIYYR